MKNRLEHIREQVKNEKKVTVSELSKIYKVTEETIRRDLEKLEKEGFLTRTFGGAVLNSASQKEHIHFYKRTSINQKEKAKIAQLFKEVLDQKRTIAADASTTVMEAIRLLKANRNITVLSSSTEIFREMTGSEIHILSTGGVFNEDSLSLQGNLAKENIRRYHVDLALLSCKGLDMDKGIMDSSEREADVKTEMVKQALEVALLADHTKFERTAFVQFLDWDKVTYRTTCFIIIKPCIMQHGRFKETWKDRRKDNWNIRRVLCMRCNISWIVCILYQIHGMVLCESSRNNNF